MSVLKCPRFWLAVHVFALGAHAHNVVCWGAARSIPSDLPESKRVALAKDFACSLDYEGGVTCFGSIPAGKTKPAGLPAVRQINAGFDNVCVVTEATRAVECWGGDNQGQSTPPALPGTTEAVSCGDWVCCAISSAGDCTCWGSNNNGEANGPPSGFVATHVACGRAFCCAGDTGGAVQCWGLETAGTRTTYENGQVTPPDALPPSATLTCGQAHACSSSTTGQVTCWGGGSPHQTTSKLDANQGEFGSLDLGTAVELTSGKFTTCVLQDDGHVVCAGSQTAVPASIQGKVAHLGGEFDTVCASLLTSTTTTTSTTTQSTSTASSSTATTSTVSTVTSTSSTSSTSLSSTTSSSRTSSSTTSETVTSSSTSSTTRSETSTTSSTSTVTSTVSTTSSTSTSRTSTSSSSSSSSSTSSVSSTTSSTTTSTSSSSTTSTSSSTTSSTSSVSSSTSSSSTSTSSTSSSSTSTSSTSSSSTSSTSSSTETSSSTSSSSSSSTTSHTAPYVSGSDGLLSFYGELEAAELERLWTGNASESRVERADVLLLVTRVPKTGEEVTVNIAGNVSMTLPGSLLSAIDGPVAAVVSVFKDDKLLKRIDGVDNDGYEAKVQAAMKLELHTPSGPYSVSASKEPMLLGLPVDKNLEQVACAYWDVRRKRWSDRGVTARKDTGSLVCATTHLTLFAAILRGFLTALACSQLTLFNSGALRQLARLSWLASPVGAAFLLVLMLFTGLMLAACMLDAKRRRTWTDEFFLIPAPQGDEGTLELLEGEGSASLASMSSPLSPVAASHAMRCLVGCKENTVLALKDGPRWAAVRRQGGILSANRIA